MNWPGGDAALLGLVIAMSLLSVALVAWLRDQPVAARARLGRQR